MQQFIYLFVTLCLILTFHGSFGGSVSRTRINGGEGASEGEFPYIISIRRIEDTYARGSSSILSGSSHLLSV